MHWNGHAVMPGFPEHVKTAGDTDHLEAESPQCLNGLLAVDSGIYGHLARLSQIRRPVARSPCINIDPETIDLMDERM